MNTVNPTNCDTLTANGQITINATGGTGLRYSINGGATFVTNNVFSSLRVGTYNVVVTKSNGSCPINYQPIILASPSGITISTVATTRPTLCGVSNGALTITATPTGTYQYSINGGQTFQTSATFSNLAQGNYSIVVKSTATGCVAYYTTNPLVLAPQSCPEICNDGIDNDGIGGVDNCPDNTCGLTPIQVQVTQTNCSTNAKGIVTINATYSYINAANLKAGDIIFTNYYARSGAQLTNEGFYFVPLVNIAGGTQIIFTDQGWGNSTNGFLSGEGVLRWTAPSSGVLAGTEIRVNIRRFSGIITPTTTVGTLEKDSNIPNSQAYGSNLNFELSSSGDQVIALIGSSFATSNLGNLVFLSAINANATTWNSTANSSSTSAIPPGLTNGTTAVAVGDVSQWSTTAPTIDNTISYSINAGETFQTSGIFSNLNPGFYKVLVKKGNCIIAYTNNPVQIYGCTEICGDNLDNDGNSKTDCADSACSVGSIGVASTLAACPPADTFGRMTINLTGTGGASYQYSINNGAAWQASATFINLNPGNYTIKIKRNNTGCETAYISNPVVLTTPICTEICSDGYDNDKDGLIDCDDPNCGVAASEHEVRIIAPTCPANSLNGKVIVSKKGSSGITYQYSKDGGLTFQADTTFANLAPGTYQIAIKNQATGCIVSYPGNPIILVAPTCPEICNNTIDDDGDGDTDCADSDCGVAPFAVAFTRPNCPPNDTTGSITITPFGAVANYQYSKNNGVTWQNTPTFSNVAEGDYTIVVKRISSGCTLAYSGNPIQLRRVLCQEICSDGIDNDFDNLIDCADPDCNVPKIEGTNTTAPSFCYNSDGSITVLAINNGGGTGDPSAWEYSKDNGATWQNSEVFTGLATGTYVLKVRNKITGCQLPNGSAGASASVTLTPFNNTSGISVFVQPFTASFCNDNDGQLIVTATNGTPPYQYRLNGGAWNTNNTFANLSSGNYTVEVAANGGKCISSTIINLPKRADINITNVSANRNCTDNSGTIQITASTIDSLALEYSINDGNTWSDSPNFTNLAAGSYQIAVRYKTDTRCVKRYATPVMIAAFTPISISSLVATPTTKCDVNDGKITIVATGNGTLEYKIAGANWQSSNQFTALAPDTYSVYVRYAVYPDSACVVAYSGNPLTVVKTIPAEICGDGIDNNCDGLADCADSSCGVPSYTLDIIQPNCPPNAITGSITIVPNGLVSDYQYRRDNGANWQSSPVFTNLVEGNYQIAVRRIGSGCTLAYAGNPVQLQRIPCQEICGDSIDNDLDNLTDCADADSPCSVAAYSVEVNQPTLDSVWEKGQIIIIPSDEKAYFYSIDSNVTRRSSPVFQNLEKGFYNVVVSTNGCARDYEDNPVEINPPMRLNEICNDCIDNDGDGKVDYGDSDCYAPQRQPDDRVVIVLNGPQEICIGVSEQTGKCYRWIPDNVDSPYNGTTTVYIDQSGTYILLVMDDEGNIIEELKYEIVICTPPTVSITATKNALCARETATLDAGTGFAKYLWSTGAKTRMIQQVKAGTYKVTVTNNSGCTAEASITITQGAAVPAFSITSSASAICPLDQPPGVKENNTIQKSLNLNEDCPTSLQLIADTQLPNYTYLWSTSATTPQINVDQPGLYSLTVTNEDGCSASTQIDIPECFDCPPAACPKLVSETFKMPDRKRTTIGIREEVTIRLERNRNNKCGIPTWKIISGGGKFLIGQNPATEQTEHIGGEEIVFQAGYNQETVTIEVKLNNPSDDCNSSCESTLRITFNVIEPNGVYFDEIQQLNIDIESGIACIGINHILNRPSAGFQAKYYILPDNVNFYNIEFQEGRAAGEFDGTYWEGYNTNSYPEHKEWPFRSKTKSDQVFPGKGTFGGVDNIYLEFLCARDRDPTRPGSVTYKIPWRYALADGSKKTFATAVQRGENLGGNNSIFVTSKTGAFGVSASARLLDPTNCENEPNRLCNN